MYKLTKRKLLLLILLFAAPAALLHSQVTIGKASPPQRGSLLELRDNDNLGDLPNASKGLGLPRVALSSPTTLTIDDESNKLDYVGAVVYNTKGTDLLGVGMHSWDGEKWDRVVHARNRGKEGQVLSSLGNGKAEWRDYYPDDYYKPTYYLKYDKDIAEKMTQRIDYHTLTLMPGVGYSGRNEVRQPGEGIFDKSDIYEGSFFAKRSTEKIVDLTFSVEYSLIPNGKSFLSKNVWIEFDYEIYINKVPNYGSDARFKHTIDFSTAGVNNVTLNFALHPPIHLPVGEHKLSIIIRPRVNTIQNNQGPADGEFYNKRDDKDPILIMKVTDLGLVLYEK